MNEVACEDPHDDVRQLFRKLPTKEALKCIALAQALQVFAMPDGVSIPDKLATLNLQLRRQGMKALSKSSAYRKLELLQTGGIAALADGRHERAANRQTTGEFEEYWHSLVASNARATSPAYRQLMRELCAGKYIPGVGTWRNIYADEHGGVRPGEAMRCPYSPENPPRGWSERNLSRIKPDAFALLAARKGRGAAIMGAIPTVVRTRVGLAPCQVVEIDDMWHEVKVAYGPNKTAERVVELNAVDVATGKVLCWLAKPIINEDGARKTLRAHWVRYLLAYVLGVLGIPKAGCLIVGEHGTATIPEDLRALLADVSGGMIRFTAGGIVTGSLAAGLPAGRGKGNPRVKALNEGLHRLIKNELGSVRGLVGGGRGAEPEEAYGLDKEDRRLRTLATALEKSRPGMLDRLSLPYMPWHDFQALVSQAYNMINARTEHDLEGWEESGYVSGEYNAPGAGWVPIESIQSLPETARNLWTTMIEKGGIGYRQRRLSPEEAWARRSSELSPLGPAISAAIMGDGLSCLCTCDNRLQLDFKVDGLQTIVPAMINGQTLDRGSKYRVWVNPLDQNTAIIADENGRFLGTSIVQSPVRADDAEQTKTALGIRQQAISAELRRLSPVIRARQAEAAERARINSIEIIGYDPALDVAEKKSAEKVLSAGHTEDPFKDFAPAASSSADPSIEDFI